MIVKSNAGSLFGSAGGIEYTDEQLDAYNKLIEFLKSNKRVFLLTGYSGAGKTTILKKLLIDARAPQMTEKRTKWSRRNNFHWKPDISSYIFTAPTNKAAKILSSVLGVSGQTIYSALKIKMDIDFDTGDLKLTYPKNPADLSQYSCCFIDESSMVPQELLDYIMWHYPYLKLIFIGDPAQLPPVNALETPVYAPDFANKAQRAHLSTVMRHQNHILELSNSIRSAIETKEIPLIEPSNTDDSGVFILPRDLFIKTIKKFVKRNHFHERNDTKVIAWTNQTIDIYNGIIRNAMYGKESEEDWLLYDSIMIAAPALVKFNITLTIDEEFMIWEKRTKPHHKYPNFLCDYIDIGIPDFELNFVNKQSDYAFKKELQRLASEAREPGKAREYWAQFWALRNTFHQARYSYAITAHRSQGSSFKNVFVDIGDILKNKNTEEALRCLYVAVSRASERVFINCG